MSKAFKTTRQSVNTQKLFNETSDAVTLPDYTLILIIPFFPRVNTQGSQQDPQTLSQTWQQSLTTESHTLHLVKICLLGCCGHIKSVTILPSNIK